VPVNRWHAELAWLGGDTVAEQVLLEVEADRFLRVTPGSQPPADAVRLPGLTIPGLVNAHSHAFHRALRGHTHYGAGDFWAWRRQMYAVADQLRPDSYLALARAVYAEMALAGITTVGEFHYLHHAPGGVGYDDANAMGVALVAAAAEAGIRISLLDTCYLQADVEGSALTGPQLRFGDGDVAGWAARVAGLPAAARGIAPMTARVGAAIHSVRAVPADGLAEVSAVATGLAGPLHLHLSEQPAENAACLAATGRTPAALCAEHGVLGGRTTAVHATHLSAADVCLLGSSATAVCLCPTTERDLADGIGPSAALRAAGSALCLGSDSHAAVDLLEEARAVELDERLASLRRGTHPASALLTAATAGGADALGWPEAGRLVPGALADFATIRMDSVRTAGADPGTAMAMATFAAGAADVTNVVVGGLTIVSDGESRRLHQVGRALAEAIRPLWS